MAERAISRKNFLCFCALKYAQLFIFCLLFFHFSTAKSAIDTITPNQNITVGETLVSGKKVFELGFFSPDKASPNKRYLGIWYYEIQPLTVVWVANREKPVLDNHGVFGMTNNGELQVMDGKGRILWSPANSNSTAKPGRVLTAKAKLLDNGNLVLQRGEDIPYHWESYKDESNTFLPGMNTENKFFRSWKSDSDPAPGDFTLGVNKVWKQFTIRNSSSSDPVWESGWSQNSVNFNEVPANLLKIMFPVENFTLILDNLKTARLVLNSSGQIVFHRRNTSLSWNLSWKGPDPEDECSMYQVCGNYGICNNVVTEGQKCKCLKGFMPDSTGGCRRKAPHEDCSNDYFVKISLAKVWHPDDDPFPANSEEECREVCKTKCCNAYLFEAVRGQLSACWTWQKDETLKDLKNSSTEEVGGNLWVRVENNTAPSGKCDTQNTSCIQPEQTCKSQEDCKQWPSSTCEPNAEGDGEGRCVCISSFHWNSKACVPVDGTDTVGSSQHSQPLLFIILLSNTAGIVLLVVGLGCLWRRMAAGKGQRNSIFQKQESDRGVKELLGIEGFPEDRTKSIDVPFFSFETIVAATEDFSVSNKLGQGGFGPVYKGKFPGGKEIAVKRLSRSSGQGLDEFKNEVVLIAKLQHRNLVRLLGYCMKGDEKMLIYEYMPNKSLDAIIFDPEKCQLLNWEMRYNIIVGVARGLLYLHQDSRLRIIHRDLKTSNILLDEDMNPKISDFGMARLFGGKQIEANTTRVAGTYGYMSPEYAIDGLFSIKSDVFSFGVVALEILSGKRNALFYHKEQAQTLLGYAWKLWYEDTGLDLMDPSLREDYNEGQALKCIQIALLCVQDDAADRPTMTEVVSMLSSENVVVPNPKQPIFYVKRFSESLASSSNQATNSNNELTVTFEGR